jgi:hypothetical protein
MAHPALFALRAAARVGAAALFAMCLVAAPGAGPALAQPAAPAASAAPQPAQLDRNAVLILIRTTLLALDQANRTGNYTVLRDLGAPAFQAANTAARLAEIFATLRAQNLDLSGAAVLDPQLTLMPQIEPNGMLHMTGFFPSFPLQINFDLLFAPVDGRWRPFGISIGVAQSSPSAPVPPPAQAAAPAKPETPQGGSRPNAPRPPSGRPAPPAGAQQ